VRKLAGRLRGEDTDIIGLPARGVNTFFDSGRCRHDHHGALPSPSRIHIRVYNFLESRPDKGSADAGDDEQACSDQPYREAKEVLLSLPARSEIRPGQRVQIVEKQNQRGGAVTEGIVARILTRSATHPHGIKVMLEDGRVGRVKSVMANDD